MAYLSPPVRNQRVTNQVPPRVARALRASAASTVFAWAIVRAFGVEAGYPTTAAMALTPYAALVALSTAVIACLLRAWLSVLLATAALGIFTAALAPRTLGGPETAPPTAAAQIAVLALNLYRGEADAQAVVELVKARDPDILCLSELTPSAVESLGRAGLNRILPHSHLLAADGAEGTGIYCRWALKPLRGVAPSVGDRRMARAQVDTGVASNLEVVSVHVHAPMDPASTDRWLAGLDGLPSPERPGVRVLAGDFNATLDHAAFRELISSGFKDAAASAGKGFESTWPIGSPPIPAITIDHILVEDRGAITSFDTVPVPGTDHRGVIAHTALPEGDPLAGAREGRRAAPAP